MELGESDIDYHVALAMLEWQHELGVDETLCEAPIDRYALAQSQPKPAAQPGNAGPDGKRRAPTPPKPKIDPIAEAQKIAAAAQDLAGLQAALHAFEHCDLKEGARNLVFADGPAAARVMIIGEMPGREEDRDGRPFQGRAGALLDKMLAAIDLSRSAPDPKDAAYLTTVLPWRGPSNRDANPAELAMMKPFVERHIALAQPEVLVLMGNLPCQMLLGKRGMTRLRGQWVEVGGIATLPMLHPEQLLRTPQAKRDAWADLLDLRARLDS